MDYRVDIVIYIHDYIIYIYFTDKYLKLKGYFKVSLLNPSHFRWYIF